MKLNLISCILVSCAALTAHADTNCTTEAANFNQLLNGPLRLYQVVRCSNAVQESSTRPLKCHASCYVKFNGKKFATLAQCHWSNDLKTNSKIAATSVQCL